MPNLKFFTDLPSVEDLWEAKDVQHLPNGPTTYQENLDRYEIVRGILNAIEQEPESELPTSVRDTAKEVKNDFKRVATEIANTDPADRRSAEAKLEAFAKTVDRHYDDVLTHLRPQLRADVRDMQDRLGKATSLEAQLRQSLAGFKDLHSKVEDLILKVTTGGQAKHFEDEAERQRNAAILWLLAVIGAGLGLAIVVAWLLIETRSIDQSEDTGWEAIGAMLATKALTIGVLSWAVSFCSRNYRSHRHMESMYRQRMAAVNTYVVMASSLEEDDAGRSIVLTELAKAVFASSETGLTPGGTSEKTIIENIIPLTTVRS
ncbi:hypothetical protein GCM10028784_28340 [Myceligenerans cantabricum]